jgi:hypothetical protein
MVEELINTLLLTETYETDTFDQATDISLWNEYKSIMLWKYFFVSKWN